MDHECRTCKTLKARVVGMAARIDRDRPWDKFMDELRRKGYDYLRRQIEGHQANSGHLVNPLAVIEAIGRHAMEMYK